MTLQLVFDNTTVTVARVGCAALLRNARSPRQWAKLIVNFAAQPFKIHRSTRSSVRSGVQLPFPRGRPLLMTLNPTASQIIAIMVVGMPFAVCTKYFTEDQRLHSVRLVRDLDRNMIRELRGLVGCGSLTGACFATKNLRGSAVIRPISSGYPLHEALLDSYRSRSAIVRISHTDPTSP